MSTVCVDKIKEHIGPLLLLIAATFCVYARILGHEFIINWDDGMYVATNETVHGLSWEHVKRAFSGPFFGNYAPLHLISYMVDFELWGLWPGGFLLTNIVVHTLNGLLIYRLFIKWNQERLMATVGAALFLLHPVQVESVAWISQRKNLLAMLFFLLAWEGYSRFRETSATKSILAYIVALVAFVMALLSKSVAVIFPVVIVMHDLCFSLPGRRVRLLDKVPFIIVAGVVSVVTLYSQLPEVSGSEGGGGGRAVAFHGGSPLATFYTMLTVFCRYLGMLVWPSGLSAIYNPAIHQIFDISVAISAIELTLIVLLCARLSKFDQRFGFWTVFIFVGFLPVSQIAPLITLMNDRYCYFPMMGFAALTGLAAVYARRKTGVRREVLFNCFLGGVLILLFVASYQHAAVWQNSRTLWSDAVIKSPSSVYAWEGLAEAYQYTEPVQLTEALQTYKRVLEIYPEHEPGLYNIGNIYVKQGDFDKAFAVYKKLVDRNPKHVMGLTALGSMYQQRKQYDSAEKSYLQARALQPDATQPLKMLGNLALIQGRLDLARSYFSQIEAKESDDPESAFMLACVESRAGRRNEAIMYLGKALQRGYRDISELNRNVNLAQLRGDPRFSYLVDTVATKR